MTPNKLIEAAVAVVFAMEATGQLPKFIRTVQIAQYKLLKESQSPNWGNPLLPFKESKKKRKK